MLQCGEQRYLKGQEGSCTCTSFSAPDLVLISSGEGQMSCLSPYKINFVEELVPFLLFLRLLSILLIQIIVCTSCSLILWVVLSSLWALQSCALQRLTCKAHRVDFMRQWLGFNMALGLVLNAIWGGKRNTKPSRILEGSRKGTEGRLCMESSFIGVGILVALTVQGKRNNEPMLLQPSKLRVHALKMQEQLSSKLNYQGK